ncbi:MAG: glycine--tRNA ligase [Clostridiales bacterium]|nr:glycine--tRNA ligase [Clostridiales bacterium]
MDKKLTMDRLVAYAKDNGFVFAGSEIYGGLANSWDYGPLGVMFKNNIKDAWVKKFVQECPYNEIIESAILMNPKVWETSGHLKMATDPLMDCKSCKARHRADHLIEGYLKKHPECDFDPNGKKDAELEEFIKNHKINCPICGKNEFSGIRDFNIMFKTHQGVTEESSAVVYLRPETAQGMFVNFRNIVRSMRKKIPFGIAQYGKSFRNEITPGNFIFRTREFEQMELEFFCKPGTDLEWFDYWRTFMKNWLLNLGIKEQNLRLRDHSKEELCFYSKATTDFEYLFPFGWGELWGLADRTDYDLTQHMNASGVNMEYTDPVTNEKYVPYCVEPAVGLNRLFLAFLADAYDEETLEGGETRVVLRLSPVLAPYKVAVFPLNKKLHTEKAQEVYAALSKHFATSYDETGSIGKRYRRQDEIGTPYCLTIDEETVNNGTVTLRDRDTMQQIVLKVEDVANYVKEKLEF